MYVRSRRNRRRHRRRRPRPGRVRGGGGAASWRGARCSEPAGCVGNTMEKLGTLLSLTPECMRVRCHE